MLPEAQVQRLLGGLGDHAVDLDLWFFTVTDVRRIGSDAGLSEADVDESLAIYKEKGIVDLERDLSESFTAGNLTDIGLDCYMQACRPSYPAEQMGVRRKLAEHLIKETPDLTNLMLADELGYPSLVVDHVLRVFARHGLLQILGPGASAVGEVLIGSISPDIFAGQLLGYSV